MLLWGFVSKRISVFERIIWFVLYFWNVKCASMLEENEKCCIIHARPSIWWCHFVKKQFCSPQLFVVYLPSQSLSRPLSPYLNRSVFLDELVQRMVQGCRLFSILQVSYLRPNPFKCLLYRVKALKGAGDQKKVFLETHFSVIDHKINMCKELWEEKGEVLRTLIWNNPSIWKLLLFSLWSALCRRIYSIWNTCS